MNKQKHLKNNSKNLSPPKSVKSKNTRRSIILTAVMAFLAGAVVLFAVALQSFKMVLLENSLSAAHGKAYFATKCSTSSGDCDNAIENARVRYHGELVGEIKLYQDITIGGGYNVVNLDVVSDFLIADLSEIPSDKIPVLIPSTEDLSKMPDQFFAVGSYNSNTIEQLRAFKAGIFMPVFSELYPNPSRIFLINDGSDRIREFLQEQHLARSDDASSKVEDIEELLDSKRIIVTFNNAQDALNYEKTIEKTDRAATMELFSNVSGIQIAFTKVYVLLVVALVILIILVIELAITVKAILDFCTNKK